jgi:tetratricopeptide (TPR) repeat protein
LAGDVLGVLGRVELAIAGHQQALTEARLSANVHEEGRSLLGLAKLFHRGSRPNVPDCAESALALFRACGDVGSEARALIAIGSQETDRGRPWQLEETIGRALELFRQIGDRSGMAIALHRIGLARHYRGEDLALARDSVAQAVQIHRELGERRLEGEALTNLAYLTAKWRASMKPSSFLVRPSPSIAKLAI